MNNKKILPSLLKINIFTLTLIFGSVVVFYLSTTLRMRTYDRIDDFNHDFSDLAQYAITLVLKMKSLNEIEIKIKEKYLNSISNFELELQKRLQGRNQNF